MGKAKLTDAEKEEEYTKWQVSAENQAIELLINAMAKHKIELGTCDINEDI